MGFRGERGEFESLQQVADRGGVLSGRDVRGMDFFERSALKKGYKLKETLNRRLLAFAGRLFSLALMLAHGRGVGWWVVGVWSFEPLLRGNPQE